MPRRRRPPGAVVVAAFLSLSATLPVLAQEATEAAPPANEEEITVSLALTGPPGCGSESDLASRIAWRTSRVRVVPVGASERRLEVTLEVTEASATATLSLTLPNGRRATRVLRGATCDEAIDATALVAAVTLDPTASTALTKPPAADAGATGGTAGSGGTAPRPEPSARPPAEGGTGGSGGEPPRSELSGGPFAAGEVTTGPAPTALLGFGVGFMGVWKRDSVLSPAFRLSGAYFPGKTYDEIGGSAYFSLLSATVDLCPIRVGNDAIAVFGCGTFVGGAVSAEGRNTQARQDRVRPWLVLGGTALVDVRPGGPFELGASGTVGSPLRRDSYMIQCAPGAVGCEPNVFYAVSSVSVQAELSFGVFFR